MTSTSVVVIVRSSTRLAISFSHVRPKRRLARRRIAIIQSCSLDASGFIRALRLTRRLASSHTRSLRARAAQATVSRRPSERALGAPSRDTGEMRAKNAAAAARKPTERRKSDAVDDDDASRPIASSAKNTKAKSSKKTNDASKSNDVGMEKDGHVEFAQAEALTGRRRTLEAKKKKSSGGFESMEILPEVFRAVKRKGYRVPTPIQRKAIPPALEGRDVVAMARTGSGKTAAFLIPVLSKLRTHSLKAGARCVVLAPTRELALQTFAFAKELSKFTNLRVAALVGGDSMEAQFADLSNNPDIIVATPGRLLHHVEEVKAFTLRTVCHVVLDEADRLLEMGFADQLRQVMSSVADVRQTLLFSATLPSALAE